MTAAGKRPATTCSRAPLDSGKSWNTTASSPSVACLHLVDQTDEAVDKSDKIYKVIPMLDRMLPLFCRHYSPLQQLSLAVGMIPTKTTSLSSCANMTSWSDGNQKLPAVRGQVRLHSRCRILHRPGQGLPLALPWINQQCYLTSCGELAGHQQEPHAVHGSFLQLCPGSGHRHAKPQVLRHGFRKLDSCYCSCGSKRPCNQ